MAAQLLPIDMVAPGVQGLFLEAGGKLLSDRFATKATNFQIDKNGVLSSREGWADQTTTAIAGGDNVESLHEYIDGTGAVEMIVAWDGGIANDIDDPEGNDVSASITDANGTWLFQNFNDKCIAFQAGQKLAIYTGTTFVTVSESSGTAPTGGVAAAAFGRIYQVAVDGTTINYSGLLDEADWGGSGAGTIDMNNVWTDGQDRITAIRGYNGDLVVFGMRHIIFITDGSGSEIGLNPTNAYVGDVITGTGCVDQHTIQSIGETELAYLSPNGVQALSRVIQEKSNPANNFSEAIRTDLSTAYRGATAGTIRSAYSPDTGRYYLTFSGSKTYVWETKKAYQDEWGAIQYPIFEWDFAPYAWCVRENGDILTGAPANVGKLTGNTDDGASLSLLYESGWLDLGEELGNRLKILKRLGATILTQMDGSILFKWGTDFNTTFKSSTKALTASTGGATSEWGTMEWGLGEWAGSIAVTLFKIPARDTGQYYKIGVSTDTDSTFAIQQLELFAKIGRLA